MLIGAVLNTVTFTPAILCCWWPLPFWHFVILIKLLELIWRSSTWFSNGLHWPGIKIVLHDNSAGKGPQVDIAPWSNEMWLQKPPLTWHLWGGGGIKILSFRRYFHCFFVTLGRELTSVGGFHNQFSIWNTFDLCPEIHGPFGIFPSMLGLCKSVIFTFWSRPNCYKYNT